MRSVHHRICCLSSKACKVFITYALVFFVGQSIMAKPTEFHWQDTGYIEKSFYNIVLDSEYERLSPVVRKWNQPLRVWMSSQAGNGRQQAHYLTQHFHQLSKITGLPIHFVPIAKQANVRVYFAEGAELKHIASREMSSVAVNNLSHSYCLGQIRFNRKAEITRGTVVVDVAKSEANQKLLPCIVEELTQMLGVINDSAAVHPTIFSDISNEDFLTGLDYLLLKLLYSPQVKAGMRAEQLSPILQDQLEEWEQAGVIHRADLILRSQSMALATRYVR